MSNCYVLFLNGRAFGVFPDEWQAISVRDHVDVSYQDTVRTWEIRPDFIHGLPF